MSVKRPVPHPKRTRCATAGQGNRGLRVPGCVEEENHRNEGQASGSRTSNHVTPFSIPESEGVAKLAWVEPDNHTGSAGTSSGEKVHHLVEITRDKKRL